MLSLAHKIIFDYFRCQQCGACEAACPKQAISFVMLDDGTRKVLVDDEKCVKCGQCVKVCPANKQEDYNDYFGDFGDKGYYLGYNRIPDIRRKSSSGGVCKTIIIESLKRGIADGVYTLKRKDEFPFAEGEFYTRTNIPEYNDIPNSVYHSLPACQNIGSVKKGNKLIVVGTACQLKAMNVALKGKAEEMLRICIFCKQQKTLGSTRFLAKIMGARIPGNLKFFARYRGEGWPGIVRVGESELPYSRAAQIPFGRRLWTVEGCNSCGDPFGLKAEADITLMDPWKIRTANDLGETLVIVNSQKGKALLDSISSLALEPMDFDSICPALDLKDVWRKQQLVPYFRGEKCDTRIDKAGRAEQRQRKFFVSVVEALPRMPMIFYRALCKLPDLRNRILK